VATDTANEQHYEVPSDLFQTFMGPHLKYSCGYWPAPETTLDEAEAAMLELTCKRAGLEDGMDILELGCGWGSLSLWMAQQYPHSSITAVSNSRTQKKFIDARGFRNLEVITADMNEFETSRKFDRVVSVEMFEHMRNWHELLRRINGWLKEDGRLFIHIFVHRELAYLFNDAGEVNWMAEHFFKEGMMPSESLLSHVNNDMLVDHHWRVNGRHYAKTLRAWLDRIDKNAKDAIAILERTYGKDARIQFGRWRIFFMACEELFGFKGGEEWYVAHYLMRKR
jgi:cyclopropane-fatty-acyl-phospholipid synthase